MEIPAGREASRGSTGMKFERGSGGGKTGLFGDFVTGKSYKRLSDEGERFRVIHDDRFVIPGWFFPGVCTVLRAENWYRMHLEVFRDTFQDRNPLILCSNHADFQQTNAVSGSIGSIDPNTAPQVGGIPVPYPLPVWDDVLHNGFHRLFRGDHPGLQGLSLRTVRQGLRRRGGNDDWIIF